MINQETQDKLSKIGFDASKLIEAVKGEEEISLDVPTLYTEDQKNSFGSNRFNDGKNAFSEIKAKEYKTKYGIEIDGKDLNKVIDHVIDQKVKETGRKPNEQIDAYKLQVSELQTKLQDSINNTQKLETEFQGRLLKNEVDNILISATPDKTKIPKQDLLTLFNSKYGVQIQDGNQVVLQNNEVLKDTLLNPVPLKDVYASFLDNGKYVEKDGMGGADYEGGSSAEFKNMDSFMKYCEKNNIEPMGSEGQKLLAEKKIKDFKY